MREQYIYAWILAKSVFLHCTTGGTISLQEAQIVQIKIKYEWMCLLMIIFSVHTKALHPAFSLIIFAGR